MGEAVTVSVTVTDLYIFFVFQLALYAITGVLSVSLVTYRVVCAEGHPQVLVTLISTSLFFCGVTTFIQVTFGLRLLKLSFPLFNFGYLRNPY